MEPLRKHTAIEEVVEEQAARPRPPSLEVASDSSKPKQALPLVHFTPTTYTQYVKPVGDRIAATCALIVFALPMLFIAAVVAISMGRPVLFQQRRVGLNGKIFNVLKFRTMNKDRRNGHSERISVVRENRQTHKSDADPRHTPVGRVLRSLSLDELPQLINIVRGDMSVVGPRPELESVVAHQYPENLDQRHKVRPGLTGLWQISARGEGAMHENGEWDLEYIEKISLLTDIKIVCKTPFAMFGGNRGH